MDRRKNAILRIAGFAALGLTLAFAAPVAGASDASPTARPHDSRVAQAGSTGGTLGKGGKSVSGGRSTAPAPAKPSPYPFDGAWSGWLRTYGGSFNHPVEARFTAVVSQGELRGTVRMYGEARTLSARVDSKGALVGGELRGANTYTLSGSIHSGHGVGSYFGWKLEYRMTRVN